MTVSMERVGVIFIILSAALWGLFPVLAHQGLQTIPPLSLAVLTYAAALVGAFFYSLYTGTFTELRDRRTYKALLMLTLCIVIVPTILFYSGARLTSGVNASMLLLAEIIFTVLLTPLWGEVTTKNKLLGAFGIFLGSLLILYRHGLYFAWGDILIIASTSTYPFGNYFSKKVLRLLSPASVLLARLILGLPVLIFVALIVEPETSFVQIMKGHWLIIIITGLVSLGLGKILWFEGLKRLDVSKSVSLGMTFPLFSLIALSIIGQETVSLLQMLGIFIMMIGVYFTVQRQSMAI